jgi:hypothetical protein
MGTSDSVRGRIFVYGARVRARVLRAVCARPCGRVTSLLSVCTASSSAHVRVLVCACKRCVRCYAMYAMRVRCVHVACVRVRASRASQAHARGKLGRECVNARVPARVPARVARGQHITGSGGLESRIDVLLIRTPKGMCFEAGLSLEVVAALEACRAAGSRSV